MVDREWGPIDTAPARVWPPYDRAGRYDDREAKRAAIEDALVGLELGGHDRKTVEWLADCDVAEVAAVVSWLQRVRLAGGRS